MNRVAEASAADAAIPERERFRYGWRLVERTGPDGKIEYDEVPLSLEDVLHPEYGDVLPHDTARGRDLVYLSGVLQRQTAGDPTALVLFDVLVFWDIPGLKQHSPDLSVFFGVRRRQESYTRFDVAEEGVRPTLLIEVVSPDYRDTDIITKVDHYHRAKVPFYVIVDRERVEGPPRLIGYRYQPKCYQLMPLDDQGRLWIEPVRLWLGTRENRVVCWDGATNQELGDYTRVSQELAEAEARATEAQTQAKKAETQAKKAQEEAKTAQAQAEAETQARLAAEARVRELEAALRRLQDPGKTGD